MLGCRNILSKESLNKKYKNKKIEKIFFSDLPPQVKDTISNIFEWYIIANPAPCGKSSFPLKMPPHFIDLDKKYVINDLRNVNRAYWNSDAKFWERNGTRFTIGKNKFFQPIECPYILNLTVYHGQLYVMGELSKEHVQIYDCKDPNYLRVHYQDYYYWVIDLEK